MPYTFIPVIAQRVMYITLDYQVTHDEIEAVDRLSQQALHAADAPVHFIVDVTTLYRVPSSLRQLKQLSASAWHPRVGWWIVINPNVAVGVMATILARLFRIDCKTATSCDEALMILQALDPTLTPYYRTVPG